MKKVVRVVALLLFIVVLVGCLLFVKHFTKDFTEDIATFYVSCGEQDIFYRSLGNDLHDVYVFDVKYTFGFLAGNADWNYKLKALQDFRYEIAGGTFYFSELDLKKLFNVQRKDDSLTIDFSKNIVSMLAEEHNVAEADVRVIPPARDKDVISLTFYADDGSMVVISGTFGNLNEIFVPATELEIDPPEVIF